MTESRLQKTFRNEVHRRIEVIRIGGDRFVIFIPYEIAGKKELRIILCRDINGRWWLTDECSTFLHESRIGTTFSGVEIRLKVREDVSGGDLKYFISAVEKLSS